MELREVFRYPDRDPEKEAAVESLLRQVDVSVGREQMEPVLAQIRELLPPGRTLTWEDAVSYLGWTDAATLPRDLVLPDAPAVEDITKEEALCLVKRILEDPADETADYYVELLDRTFPNTSISDLIFNPEFCEDYTGDGEPTAEEIVEIAFRSRLHILTLGDGHGE